MEAVFSDAKYRSAFKMFKIHEKGNNELVRNLFSRFFCYLRVAMPRIVAEEGRIVR
jgi:hypothetical protein